ncbi:hypothetical protein SNE40_016990 [Patella caerulea]|uniref:Uncharacterized protein n=1 Tax=Patella caerulea TaxID=87958 RepID=A0AAN8PPG1_PATCE
MKTLQLVILACVGISAKATITGDATCDNIMEFYADGVLFSNINDNDWTKSSPITISDNTQVIAVKCVDTGVVGGIKLALSNGIKTDTTWKCSATYEDNWETPEFNDGSWPNAILPTFDWGPNPAALNGNADWIWTTGFQGQDTTVFCRKVIKSDCDCCKSIHKKLNHLIALNSRPKKRTGKRSKPGKTW